MAEQLAKLVEDLPDDPTTFRSKLPIYLARAIDHATGLVPANHADQGAPTVIITGGATA